MIPLRQSTTKSLGTTLLSYSRQALPRPARLYSTPSTARHNAYLAQPLPPQPELPPYMSKPTSQNDVVASENVRSFLDRNPSYTVLPTPLPADRNSCLNDLYFPDSVTQDSLAVIDACLHNHYDIPRAKQVFETLRRSSKAEVTLDIRIYNALLEAFVAMAAIKDSDNRLIWLEDASTLFESMERGTEAATPNATTYAIMLANWLKFNPNSAEPVSAEDIRLCEPRALLRGMIDRQIPVSHVIASRTVSSDQEAAGIIKLLSKTAVDMNLISVVDELSRTKALANSLLPDPLQDIPEAKPVLRPKAPQEFVQTSENPQGPTDPSEQEVPFNLEVLRKHLGQLALARRVLPDDVAARQKLLEDSVYEEATERLKHQAEVFDKLGLGDGGLKRSHLQRLMWDWHQKLQKRLKSEIAQVVKEEESKSESKVNVRLGPFLSLVSPDKLSLITILELMRLQGSGGVSEGMKTARALLTIGKSVELEHKAQMCRRNNITIPTSNSQAGSGYFTKSGYRDLYARRVAARKYVEDSEEWAAAWTQILRVKVGSFLVDALMDVATVVRSTTIKNTGEVVSEEQPAFFHSYEYLRGHKLGVIRLNPQVSERMTQDGLRETLHPRQLPMLVKPKPWLSFDQGGYLYSQSSAMRFKDSQEQQIYLRHASDQGHLELVYAGLDVLGSTPWQVNRKVFDVVLKVWNSGERVCKIPPAVYDVPEPQKSEADSDPKAKMVYLARQKAWSQGKANNHSDRCSVNYKIEIARAFLGDVFYLPHNMDFRGRAYPIPPHLNHIGDDLSRGLLLFSEAKPLGQRGLRWLKVHLANLCGFDKGSFDERVQFVEDHMADIYDSAERPLEGNRWWQKAEDPWQCLAACMELRSALESPDPHSFESNFPVHQDGTCNGLQHYAALGGDTQGANQVNLGATERPSDVYSYVAAMVQEKVKVDAANQVKHAMLLDGKITRKVVKQTVMTTVYGVTFIGARDQIEKQLKDRKDIPSEQCWLAAAYLAKRVMECIGDLFTGAKDIQTWLNLCARLISKSIPPARIPDALSAPAPKKRNSKKTPAQDRVKDEQMTTVIWTTPLGLPIVQPYRKTKRNQVATTLQTVYISDPNAPATVNAIKQASAFPPNFIHSLDATHMMLTALECQTQGLTFASVHDSYWTHACSIDQMSTIIRDTFIALHSSNVLSKLHEEFLQRYKGYRVPINSIKSGSLLKKLAAREQTTSDDVLHSVTKPDPKETETIGPLTTTEELLDALDLAIGSDGKETWEREPQEPESLSTKAEIKDVEVIIPMRRRRRRKPQQQGETNDLLEKEPRFVELTKLLPPLPEKGNFEVNSVKKSLYFFS